MTRKSSAPRRVGLLLLAALAVFAGAVFLVGERRNLFSSKNHYTIRFDSVSGLDRGSNVQLDGVNVGSISAVKLPEDVEQSKIEVRVWLESRYAGRIREDSMARTRTLGLLGDKYIEISSGSPSFPEIPDGGQIGTAPVTDVDTLRASGEDLIQNVTRITEQLTTILGRMERGEGLLGELSKDVAPDRNITTSFLSTLDSLRGAIEEIRHGKGAVPRLLNDAELAGKLESTVTRLDDLLTRAGSSDSALSLLIDDTAQRDKLATSIANIEKATSNLEAVTAELRGGTGLLPKLIHDREYGAALTADLRSLIENLNRVAEKLDHGAGSAAKILNDPQLYQAMKDIVAGVNESKILRHLIRNRQKKGAEKRLEEELEESDRAPAVSEPPAARPMQ